MRFYYDSNPQTLTIAAIISGGLLLTDDKGVPSYSDLVKGTEGHRIEIFGKLENGGSQKIKAEQLAPGDIVTIRSGDKGKGELLVVGHHEAPKEKIEADFEQKLREDEQALIAADENHPVHPFVFAHLGSGDKDGADRVAKALIHAIVLCNVKTKQSLF